MATSTATTAPRTARERVRVELTNEIKTVARRHLARDGSAALSLRAVARDVGMVSSAVYRYFPSRDELLTALIIDAYSSFGECVVRAEAAIRRSDFAGRWMASCRAARAWALAEPQQYALIFGSPIPGYVAPQDTVDPAAIVPVTVLGILADAAEAGMGVRPIGRPIPRAVRADLRGLRESARLTLADEALSRAIMAWTQLIGSISFELFGHLHNVIFDVEAYFDHQMRGVCVDLGLAPFVADVRSS